MVADTIIHKKHSTIIRILYIFRLIEHFHLTTPRSNHVGNTNALTEISRESSDCARRTARRTIACPDLNRHAAIISLMWRRKTDSRRNGSMLRGDVRGGVRNGVLLQVCTRL